MGAWSDLWDWSADQHHVTTVDQAVAAGLAESTFRDLARRHGCSRPQRSVVAAPAAVLGLHANASAALLSLGRPALVAGRAAGFLHGFVAVEPPNVDILVPHERGGLALRSPARIVRTRRWTDVVGVEVDRLDVVEPSWALLDVVTGLVAKDRPGAIIDAVQQRRVELADLSRVLQARPRLVGRRGIIEVVADLDLGIQSVFERRILPLLRRAGLPLPRAQLPVRARDGRTLHLDWGYDEWPVAMECVGLLAHRSRRHLVADTARLNGLRGSPIRIVWIEWTGLFADPFAIVSDIANELWRAGARWPGAPRIRRL